MAIDTENDKQDNRTHTNTHSFNRNPFKITLRIRYDSNYFIRIVVALNKKKVIVELLLTSYMLYYIYFKWLFECCTENCSHTKLNCI